MDEEEEGEIHAGFGESLMSPIVRVVENPYAPPTVEDDDEEDKLLALYSQLKEGEEEEGRLDINIGDADQHSIGSSSSNSNSPPRCSGLTAKGEACQRTVAEPGGLCYQHQVQQQSPADNDLAVDDDSERERADSRRCSGITAKGERCQRVVDEAGGFCYQHRDKEAVNLRAAEGEEGEPRSPPLRRKGKFTAHILEKIDEDEEDEAGEVGRAPARAKDTEIMSLFKARVEAAKEERGVRNKAPSSKIVARLRALAEDKKEESEPRRSARLSTFLAFSEAAAKEQ